MNGFDEIKKSDTQADNLQNGELSQEKNAENVKADKSDVEYDTQVAREKFEKHRMYLIGISTSGLFIALMIISAFISIPVTTSVKFTLQFLVTNVCCLLLGKKWGTLSVFLYILLGLFGLPIFSNGGGFAYVLQPSFGFLIGMMIGGFFASWFREKVGKNNFLTYFLASLIDLVILDIVGVAYGAGMLYGYMHSTMGVWAFLMAMLIPFIPIDIAKCVISSLICPKLSKFSKFSR
ncbi:MAG: biotin transporter BioY [Clostridia bacterium]|nr:biotin transporter BioY [Clostridia bacterium]